MRINHGHLNNPIVFMGLPNIKGSVKYEEAKKRDYL
jgi:hypothetical protein